MVGPPPSLGLKKVAVSAKHDLLACVVSVYCTERHVTWRSVHVILKYRRPSLQEEACTIIHTNRLRLLLTWIIMPRRSRSRSRERDRDLSKPKSERKHRSRSRDRDRDRDRDKERGRDKSRERSKSDKKRRSRDRSRDRNRRRYGL